MWDKSIDEGIFLCDHESNILTSDFLRSLSYVQSQLNIGHWIEPNQFLSNEIEFIAYIILKHSTDVSNEIYYKKSDIKLTNRKLNDLFQDQIFLDYWDTQLFIYKLFDPKAIFDTLCARCNSSMDIWDDVCKNCLAWEDEDPEYKLPNIRTVHCLECSGFSYTHNYRRITYYCEFNTITKHRVSINCKKCNDHFDWLENKDKNNFI